MALRTTASASSRRVTSAGGGVPADPLHGAQHLDDGFLPLGNRVLDDGDLLGEFGEFGFRLRKLRLAILHPLAGLDQLRIEPRPFYVERRDILDEPLFLGAARPQLLLGFVEPLLRLIARQVFLRDSDDRQDAKDRGAKHPGAPRPREEQSGPNPWPFGKSIDRIAPCAFGRAAGGNDSGAIRQNQGKTLTNT